MYILSVFVLICFQNSSNAGILRTGNPLPWSVAKPVLNSVRLSGIKQFIFHYNRSKDIKTPLFLWGDEIEYGLFGYDAKSKRFDLSLRGQQIREQLSLLEKDLTDLKSGCEWQPEYGSWMIEAVPRDPYGGYISDLLLVEKSMQLRRKRLHAVLNANEIAPTSANFPMMGVDGYAHTISKRGSAANSEYLSDDVINPHPRFGTLTRNIRQRRQSNVDIRIAALTTNTEKLRADVSDSDEECVNVKCTDDNSASLRNTLKIESQKKYNSHGEKDSSSAVTGTSSDDSGTIHMDAMAFGMGCCCLQVTMQANDDRESRFVHDQLALLAPLFLALSASTPIFKVDDRTDSERGVAGKGEVLSDPELVAGGKKRLSKSRYSAVSCFIGKPASEEEQRRLDALNDVDANRDEEAFQLLLEGGLDRSLAAHIAHLFVRDPLVIFDDAVVLDDRKAMDHFENIQSTNWRTMRWKSPCLEMGIEAERRAEQKQLQSVSESTPLASAAETGKGEKHEILDEIDIQTFGPGWRVEFRPLEIQLTDFENAAFSLLTVLTTRSLLAMGYNFYLPVSMMEENMRRSQLENAVKTQKFWVRKESFSPSLTTVPLTTGSSKNVPKNIPGGASQFGTIKRATGDMGGNTEGGGGAVCLVPSIDDVTAIELSLDEFFNGREGTAIDRAAGRQGEAFPGLIPAIYGYLEALGCDALMIGRLRPYLTLLQKRASGELPTTAQWIRRFVRTHEEYNGDGTVTPGIANDLLMLCDDIGMGRIQRPDLLGDVLIEPLCPESPREALAISSSPPYSVSSSSSQATFSPSLVTGGRGKSEMGGEKVEVDAGSALGQSKAKRSTCVSYTPISVCSRNVVSCFRGDENEEGDGLEQAVQVPWIAHVLMGSGKDPDTYLDINLIQ